LQRELALRYFLATAGLSKFPDVPLVVELVTNSDHRQAIELLSLQQEMGRPLLMPRARSEPGRHHTSRVR